MRRFEAQAGCICLYLGKGGLRVEVAFFEYDVRGGFEMETWSTRRFDSSFDPFESSRFFLANLEIKKYLELNLFLFRGVLRWCQDSILLSKIFSNLYKTFEFRSKLSVDQYSMLERNFNYKRRKRRKRLSVNVVRWFVAITREAKCPSIIFMDRSAMLINSRRSFRSFVLLVNSD